MIHIHEPICACPCSCSQYSAQELVAKIYIPQVSVYSQGLAWLWFAFILLMQCSCTQISITNFAQLHKDNTYAIVNIVMSCSYCTLQSCKYVYPLKWPWLLNIKAEVCTPVSSYIYIEICLLTVNISFIRTWNTKIHQLRTPL